MAFRQPTYQAAQRTSYASPEVAQEARGASNRPAQQQLADSQEWILFSPSAASTTDRTHTTSAARTRTAGRSRISDFGSINSAARSYGYSEDAIEEDDEVEEEDEELDSLDSHLHEFNKSEPGKFQTGTVLPTHDGLGSFRLHQTAMGDEVQEHLYAFERFNPRRPKRRRQSAEFAALLDGTADSERTQELERIRRIEEWRMEQSKVLVSEIQRETRRRKLSISSERVHLKANQEQEDVATLSNIDNEEDDVHDVVHESLWNRITKRVIRDLMGIDDDLLAIILGESLAKELSTTPTPQDTLIHSHRYHESSWEYKLLKRISRELGILVDQITRSEQSSTFPRYVHMQNSNIPYAGLSIIPESIVRTVEQTQETSFTSNQPEPEFVPTLQANTNTQPIPIPISSTSLAPTDADATPRADATLTKEEWESDLDIKLVFRYLRDRVTARFRSSPAVTTPTAPRLTGSAHLATASTADTAAKAARVRQHHPLVNGRQAASPRTKTYKVSVPGGGLVRRGSSSCASERMAGGAKMSGSSRHYWDWSGSVGSAHGSVVGGAGGGMGSWGEV